MDDQPIIFLPQIVDGEDKQSILKNRLRKNYRHLRKWAKRTITNCFRIYDREIKQYPLAIDFYAGRYCVHFFAKDEGEQELVFLQTEVNQALADLFGTKPSDIYWRIRSKFKETRQYEKLDSAKDFFIVYEYGVKFNVNLTDYLDTGLFLDHRETRQQVAKACIAKRLLNLFAYTCSFSVHAAHSGALSTKSVDMSNTYIEWGRQNFLLNGFSLQSHEFVRADCLKFLAKELSNHYQYDVIVIDPPTISRSKKMDQLFDIQVDYISLIKKSLELLAANGVIFFSTNSRQFKFDTSLFSSASIKEISKYTLPEDFHNQKIHRCWKIERLKGAPS